MTMKPDLAEWHRRSQKLRQLPYVTQTSPGQLRHVREWAISRRRGCVLALRQAAKAEAEGRRKEALHYRMRAREQDALATGIEMALLFLFYGQENQDATSKAPGSP
jgi:hypothetical protein